MATRTRTAQDQKDYNRDLKGALKKGMSPALAAFWAGSCGASCERDIRTGRSKIVDLTDRA